MSAQKKRTPQEVETLVALAQRKQEGAKVRDIAAEFGMTRNEVQARLYLGERCIKARAVLENDPTNIEALDDIGFMAAGQLVWGLVRRYEIERLTELEEWSRAELLMLPDVGKKSVDEIEAATRTFGLALHPDRDMPLEHPKPQPTPDENWAYQPREKLIEAAGIMVDTYQAVHDLLESGGDDDEAFCAIAQALQDASYGNNSVVKHLDRLAATPGRNDEMRAAVEARAEANQRVAALVVASSGGGNVIQFPRLRA